MAVVQPSVAKGHTGDVAKQVLGNILEERVSRIKTFVDNEQAVSRDELAKFVWSTARKIYETLAPNKDTDGSRVRAWNDAKGMLKELIDWTKFKHAQCDPACINQVLEKKVVEVLDAYRNFVLTGEIRTKYVPPKLLGETDEIICVDKPCMYTCSYGSRDGEPPRRALKHLGDKASASMLLNGDVPEIQLHEYLALKYQFECAKATREYWKVEDETPECKCGSCEKCAATQTGCCNRLDKETSGVMIVAKNLAGFPEVRRQFASEHSLEEGGTEKYYLCLVHGEVHLPTVPDDRNPNWKHTTHAGRGRIQVDLAFDKKAWKSLPWDDTVHHGGQPPPEQVEKLAEWRSRGGMDMQTALSFYEPVAWFEYGADKQKFTLVKMQIITGRTHQIRFHMEQIGHSLVGDSTYGAPFSDRGWCPRVFLHSYQTKFREPFTDRWFEATSPLPQDLGEIIQTNMGAPVKVKEGATFKSRRVHDKLQSFLKQYDPNIPLLFTHDAPVNKEEVMRRVAYQREAAASGARAGAWKALPGTQSGFNTAGYPLRPGGKLCMMFERSGSCTFHAGCQFNHPEELVVHPATAWNSLGLPIRACESTVCPEYLRTGAACAEGASCKYNHPDDRSEAGVSSAVAGAKKLVATTIAAAERAAVEHQAAGGASKSNGVAKQSQDSQWWQGGGGSSDGGWNSSGAQWGNSSSSWDNNNKWNGDAKWSNAGNGWSSGWSGGSSASNWKPEPQAKAAKKEEDSDEDDWGGWSTKKEESEKPKVEEDEDDWGGWTTKKEVPSQEPAAKKAKVEPQPQVPQFAPFQPLGGQPLAQPVGPPAGQLPAQPAQFRPMAQPVGQAPGLAPAASSGWKRMESRTSPGIYYYWHPESGQTMAEPPPPWEKRESRSKPGTCYYWNTVTGQTEVQKPEV
mmetsp:Transcript_83064/g.240360  ORF Transcript_83064/g.240360 Transcript_83064/m.240360 type:complete len:908 (-) Transcript_83064:147-2870(-)